MFTSPNPRHRPPTRVRTLRAAAALSGAGAALAFAAAPASATLPTHTTETFSSTETLAAGDLCDVAIRLDIDFAAAITTFGDPAAPDRVAFHQTAVFTYTNPATGATVTDTTRANNTILNGGETITGSGFFSTLRDSNGKVIDVAAGRFVYDVATGEFVSTPGNQQEYNVLVCGALGAAAAG